ncbi:MAG: phage protease [Tannerella sp.]|jgi:hypothetical protein|nr:phage protease [Tannerella sp.]
MAFKRINKEFCLTDSTVNCYGYRLLTEGLQMDRFTPPVGFFMHNRDKGIAVRWQDFKTEGDKLYATPSVNTNLFPTLADEIEAGFYVAASVGSIVALEVSEDETLKLDGQTGFTVTKWYPREISIVDIPGNYNAIARDCSAPTRKINIVGGLSKLYDENDNLLYDLSGNLQLNIIEKTMSNIKPQLTVAMLSGLSLADGATQGQADTAFADLLARANRTDALEKELKELKASQNSEALAAIIAAGKKDGKLTVELAAKLEKDYAGNPEGLKSLVDTLPAQNRVTGKAADLSGVPEKYRGKTREDLYVAGLLEPLKSECPEYFNQIMKGEI